MIIIYLSLFFILLVLLLRLKIPFTAAILLLGLLFGLKFGLGFAGMGRVALDTLRAPDTISIIATVGLVLVFSELLSRSGHLAALSELSLAIFGPHRFTLLILPALIGLLPMPGGALISAPMVDDVSETSRMPAHKKTLLNYWFRHIWEYAWPLYPGLLVASQSAHLSIFKFSILLSPLALVAIITGMLFILPGIVVPRNGPINRSFANLGRFLYALFPIALIVILFLVVQLPIWLCMLISVLYCVLDKLITRKLTPLQVIRFGLGGWRIYEMILIVASVLVFGGIITASGVTDALANFFTGTSGRDLSFYPYGLAALLFLPFIIGLLTGLTLAFVGTTFPILLSTFIPSAPGNGVFSFVILAYAAGLAGVMLSPMHLCLILTNQYFGSSLKKVYYSLVPIVLIVLLSAFGLFWIYCRC